MIIALSETCTLFDPSNEIHLQSLLRTAFMRWHTIACPEPAKLRKILPPHLWRLYGELLTRSYKSALNSRQTWVAHVECGECDAERVAQFYTLPSLLVVENAHSDGAWAEMVAQCLRPGLERYFREPYPMIVVAQAGGLGEIPKELRRQGARYVNLRPCQNVPLRVLALTDSDAKEPGRPSQQALEVLRAAAKLGAAAHVLSKRSIENYVPDSALLEYATTRADRLAAVRKIVSLSGAARDHYPMKTGLSTVEISSRPAFYPASIGTDVGLGDFIQDLLQNFYHTIDASDLRARDGAGELDVFLDDWSEICEHSERSCAAVG